MLVVGWQFVVGRCSLLDVGWAVCVCDVSCLFAIISLLGFVLMRVLCLLLFVVLVFGLYCLFFL